ncbi:MAG: hypothetical protein G8345_14675 [Magnetococcales bacterium]|nr:hypothetical protein [Magnetococcales bacterium]NGZ28121.1 hypothetical protein [Magnetococcales bacterium]
MNLSRSQGWSSVTRVGPIALILLLTWLVYGEAYQWDYFQYDDEDLIKNNPVLAGGLNLASISYAFVQVQPFAMPMVWLSYLLDVSLTGTHSAAVYHVSNVLYHMVNTLLVYQLVGLLGQSQRVAWLTAALFALHPQHVEAVAWIMERKELVAFLFGILAVLAYVRWLKAEKSPGWRWLAVACYLLSLLAKPQWITLPFLLLLLDGWPLGRTREGWQRLVGEKWPFFALTVIFSLITTFYFSNRNMLVGLEEITLESRLLAALHGVIQQLAKTFWPQDLAVIYPSIGHLLNWQELVGGTAILLGVSGLVWWGYRRGYPWWAVGWLWYLGSLFPTLGLVNGGTIVGMADRWNYLPHVLFFLALARGSEGLLTHPLWKKGVMAGVGVVVAAMTLVSQQQAHLWRSSESLWISTLEASQPWPNPHVHWLLGNHYLDTQRRVQALPHLLLAYQQAPAESLFVESLLVYFLQEGQHEQALVLLESLLNNPRTTPEQLMSVGESLLTAGLAQQAVTVFTLALRQPPRFYTPAFANAMLSFSRALFLNGEKNTAFQALGFYLNGMNRLEEHCQQARQRVKEETLGAEVVRWCEGKGR